MDLTTKCNLIDGLVREDHDTTIADYLAAVKEIETIENTLYQPIKNQ
jgi:hypothetical protein